MHSLRFCVLESLWREELAFYDALETNDSAVKVLGEPTLTQIARELVEAVHRNITIDWNIRETPRAQTRVLVNVSCANTAIRSTSGESHPHSAGAN